MRLDLYKVNLQKIVKFCVDGYILSRADIARFGCFPGEWLFSSKDIVIKFDRGPTSVFSIK